MVLGSKVTVDYCSTWRQKNTIISDWAKLHVDGAADAWEISCPANIPIDLKFHTGICSSMSGSIFSIIGSVKRRCRLQFADFI